MNIQDIDLSDYILCSPEQIKKNDERHTFIDIEVANDNTFFIAGQNNLLLAHNCDGDCIASLLINFLYRNWKQLFDEGRVFKVLTPLLVAKKGKQKLYFYTDGEYEKWASKGSVDIRTWELEYKKGLASLVDEEYQTMIQSPKLMRISADEAAGANLDVWFGGNAQMRKDKLNK